MTRSLNRGACALSAVYILSMTQAPAIAQESATGAESSDSDTSIIVTARRREERISDVPAAVDVLDQQAIADRGGLVTLQDLANNVPSVNFANTSTPSTSEISMRGSGTARATNAEGGVGLYRNGTYVGGGRIGGRTFTRMDFFDLDRIEVLRGVQGALYGRNAVGGSLNLINVQPQFENGGYFKVGYGSHIRAEAQGAVNLAVSDSFAVRIGGDLMEQGEGSFYNPVKREYFDEQRARGIRAQARLRTGILDANILVEKSYAKLQPIIYSLAIAPGTAGFPRGVTQDPYNIGWNGDSVAQQKQQAAIFTASLDLPFADFSTAISKRRRSTDHGFDADGLDPVFLAFLRTQGGGLQTDPNQSQLQQDVTKTTYIEAHLSDKGSSPLKWLIGYEHLTIKSASLFTVRRTPTGANPSPGTLSPTQLNTWSDAGFASLGYDFTDRIAVTGEIRCTRERKTLDADRFDIRTGASQGPRLKISASGVDTDTSYTLTGSYKFPSIRGQVYARYGTGFRAGGFNNDLGDPRAPNPVQVEFGAENATSMELGFKGDLFSRFTVNLAAYQTDTDNALFQDVNGCNATSTVCPAGETAFLRNGGKSRVRGAELQADGRFRLFGGQLRLTGAASYLDASIISGRDAGKRVPQVPEWTFTVGTNYVAPLGDRLKGFLNVQYFSRSGGVQEISQTPDLVDYYNVDMRVGLRLDGMELAAFANNLTDKRYIIFSTPTLQRRNYPRVFGIQFSKKW